TALRNPDGTITIRVIAADGAGPVTRVASMYLDGGGWHYVDLSQLSGTLQWEATVIPVNSVTIDAFAEAEDVDDNAGYSTNKGGLFPSQPALQVTAVAGSITAVEGGTFSGPLATFGDPDGNIDAAAYLTTVSWGDGRASAGTVTYSPTTQSFTVRGTHQYR